MNVGNLRPIRTCKHCKCLCQCQNDKAISYLARLAVFRQSMRKSQIKQLAVAHTANMHSGHFARLLNGKRPLTNKTWPAIKAALQEHRLIS